MTFEQFLHLRSIYFYSSAIINIILFTFIGMFFVYLCNFPFVINKYIFLYYYYFRDTYEFKYFYNIITWYYFLYFPSLIFPTGLMFFNFRYILYVLSRMHVLVSILSPLALFRHPPHPHCKDIFVTRDVHSFHLPS